MVSDQSVSLSVSNSHVWDDVLGNLGCYFCFPSLIWLVNITRLKTGSIIGCNTFRTIDSVSGDKGLWVPGDCLTTQTIIATAYTSQSSESDKPVGSVRWSMLRTVMEWRKENILSYT